MERHEPYSTTLNRIRRLKQSGKYAEAENEIRERLRENPDDRLMKASLADVCLRQGRLAEARLLAEEVLAADPQHPQALFVLGDLFLKEHAPQSALDCYRQAFSRDPRPYLHLKTAKALKEMGRYQEALEELDRVLVVDRQNFFFLKEKASILNRLERFDEALEFYERAGEIRPGDAFVKMEIWRLRSRTRPKPQVLKELTAVAGMESRKDDPEFHSFLAQTLKESGQVREAAAEYAAASALDPRNLFFRKQQGFCHYKLKEYRRAIECLADTLRRDPADYAVRNTLEKSYVAAGDLQGFVKLLEEVFRLYPQDKTFLGMIRKFKKLASSSQESDIP